MPTYLRAVRGLSATGTGGFLLVQILGALFGFLLGAYLSDAIGRKWTFMWSAIGSFVMILIYMFVPMDNTTLLFAGIPLFTIFLMKFPPMGVRHDKAALSSGCKPHPAIRSSRKQPEQAWRRRNV